MSDLFEKIEQREMTPELRKELMDLANSLRSSAEKIDRICARKSVRELDDNGEPTFRFAAKVELPKDFYITKRLWGYAQTMGFNAERIKGMADAFSLFYGKSGRKWQHWGKVWMDWVRREKERGPSATPMTSDRMAKW